jgi:uncharacterized OB-fold protein
MNVSVMIPADQDTQPFWDAVAAKKLVIPQCNKCHVWVWLPKPVCPACHTTELLWVELPSTGRVMSWIVVHPPVVPVFQPLVPFVVLLVEVVDGVRVVGQLVDDDGMLMRTDGSHVKLAMGAPVALRWFDQDGQLLPAWALSA